jgi:Peptidase family S41/Tetratricopeptide repeat
MQRARSPRALIHVAGTIVLVVGALLPMGIAQSQQARREAADARSFAAPTAFPYYTSDPYGRNASETFPRDPADYYERLTQSRRLVADGDCAGAIRLLTPLVEEYPDDPRTRVDLGLCQGEAGDTEAAIASLESALELGTGSFEGRFDTLPAEVMVRIGLLYARAGDTESALEWIRRGLDARYSGGSQLIGLPGAGALAGNAEFDALVGIADRDDLTREERWLRDIAFLRDRVARLHFDPDFRTSAAELDAYLESLIGDLPALSDAQIVARLRLFMGRVGSGHDALFVNAGQIGAPDVFAFRCYFFTDGLYIIEAEDESLIGARIDAFGRTPTRAALGIVTEAIARDNNMGGLWSGPRYLVMPVMLEALGIIDDASDATITITDRSGAQRVVSPRRVSPGSVFGPALAAPPGVDPPLYLSRLSTPYWTTRLEGGRVLYAQVNGMFNGPDESFTAFVERLQREAAQSDVRDLVLDLRHNAGGNDYLAKRLLRVLVYFDADPDKGELYVLIGRGTYSAGQIFVTMLEALSDAILVGEQTSSRPNFIGRTGNFTLPYSGLSGFISSELSQNSDPEDHRIWTAPDIPVGVSSQDFFAGADPALDAVTDVIRARSIEAQAVD